MEVEPSQLSWVKSWSLTNEPWVAPEGPFAVILSFVGLNSGAARVSVSRVINFSSGETGPTSELKKLCLQNSVVTGPTLASHSVMAELLGTSVSWGWGTHGAQVTY